METPLHLPHTLTEKVQATIDQKTDSFKEWVFSISSAIIGSLVVFEGIKLFGWIYEQKVEKEKISKDFPTADPVYIDSLFSSPKLLKFKSAKNEVVNKEMNEIFRSTIERAKNHDGVSVVYGSSGIGKTTSLQYVLNNTAASAFYFPVADGLFDVTAALVPEVIHKDPNTFQHIKTLGKALLEYGIWREGKGITENSIVIIDNVEKIPVEELKSLKNLASSLIDSRSLIQFVFISNDKDPTQLLEGIPKLHSQRLAEPSSAVADEYLRRISVEADYIRDIEKITGTTFKYLTEVATIRRGLIRERFMAETRSLIHEKISLEISKYLDQEIYPEIMEICNLILESQSIPLSMFWRITGNLEKDEIKREGYWSSAVLKKGLFLLDRGQVTFENRATREYVRNLIKSK